MATDSTKMMILNEVSSILRRFDTENKLQAIYCERLGAKRTVYHVENLSQQIATRLQQLHTGTALFLFEASSSSIDVLHASDAYEEQIMLSNLAKEFGLEDFILIDFDARESQQQLETRIRSALQAS